MEYIDLKCYSTGQLAQIAADAATALASLVQLIIH